MTLAEFGDILQSTGLPLVYRAWEAPPTLPYLVFFMDTTENFGADNRVYAGATRCVVELYSERKALTAETLVESALIANDVFFDKTETWIADERLFLVAYRVTI